jgi:DNA polymerase elongation subunit (family B)
MQEGALRGVSMQTYESHIPYVMQFTTDYNIAPMGWMHLRTAKVRRCNALRRRCGATLVIEAPISPSIARISAQLALVAD